MDRDCIAEATSVRLTRMRHYCDLMIPSAVYYAALRVAVRARCTVAYLVGCACKSNGLWSNNSAPCSYTGAVHPRKPNNTSAVATPTFAQASRAGLLRSLASCRVNASLSDVPRAPLNI